MSKNQKISKSGQRKGSPPTENKEHIKVVELKRKRSKSAFLRRPQVKKAKIMHKRLTRKFSQGLIKYIRKEDRTKHPFCESKEVQYLTKGSFGKIFAARGRQLVVKKIDFLKKGLGWHKRVLMELLIPKFLMRTWCPNLLELTDLIKPGTYDNFSTLYLIFEKMQQTLTEHQKQNKLHKNQIREILYGVVKSIFQLHSLGIIHCDIKPANVLISITKRVLDGKSVRGYNVRLIDFGLSCAVLHPHDTRLQRGTLVSLWYRPCELMKKDVEPLRFSCDMWAVGCIFHEIITGTPVFPYGNEAQMLFGIDAFCRHKKKNLARLKEKFGFNDPYGLDLLDRLLEMDTSKRIDAEDALEHEYFRTCRERDEEFSIKKFERMNKGKEFVFDLDQFYETDDVRRYMFNTIQNHRQVSSVMETHGSN